MKKILIAMTFLCMFSVVSQVAYATESTSTSTKKSSTGSDDGASSKESSATKKLNSETKAADAITHCETIQTKITTTTARYGANKNRNVVAYQNLVTRITKFATRFKAAGLDTAQLDADITTLTAKVTKLNTDYETYIAALANTKNYVCGKSEGQFKTALSSARVQMAVVKTDITDIHSFYLATLKPDLITLKAQVVDKEDSATSKKTDTSTTTEEDRMTDQATDLSEQPQVEPSQVPSAEPAAAPAEPEAKLASDPANTAPSSQTITPHKSTLGITLVVGAVILLLGLGAIYWYTSQASSVDETPASSTSIKKTSSSTATTISPTPATSGVTSSDIDSEITSLDSAIGKVKTTDFDSAALADTNLGL